MTDLMAETDDKSQDHQSWQNLSPYNQVSFMFTEIVFLSFVPVVSSNARVIDYSYQCEAICGEKQYFDVQTNDCKPLTQ